MAQIRKCANVDQDVGHLNGAVVGCAAALALGRLAESFLFGVSGTQPGVIVGAVVGVALVTVVAAVLPASRAARIDPAVALRAE